MILSNKRANSLAGSAMVMAPLLMIFAAAGHSEAQAAGPAPKGSEPAAAKTMQQGRQLFQDWSCGACHVLHDAGGHGQAGPSLDQGHRSIQYIAGRIANGGGPMPPFAGSLNDDEIEALAIYIAQEPGR
ncbi:c-type cytochrome [Altericroceibacterium endophyticum]|uniref:Cytochrome c domain-containing protein n=1 Tax=Altericroceibacterium endophyticum TaxID=1808508 RepID=A0A6I4T8Q8_9SPHN|nr:cytochrome c [Altericroceibacterium endophyticum]MXO66652.1 hypothetical protein [Altericroceibacterium endophyticum]